MLGSCNPIIFKKKLSALCHFRYGLNRNRKSVTKRWKSGKRTLRERTDRII